MIKELAVLNEFYPYPNLSVKSNRRFHFICLVSWPCFGTMPLQGMSILFNREIRAYASVRRARAQAMVESCLVMAVLCLLLFGLFQISRLFVADDVLRYAAARGARARAVGFNEFMILKTVRAATIVNAGEMLEPHVDGGPSAQRSLERGRIPLYMGAQEPHELPSILDYADWRTISYSIYEGGDPSFVECRVRQQFPLRTALHRAFYADDSIPLRGESQMENHYPLYLETP